MFRITAALAATAMLAVASAASAQEARVAYGDLDLSTAAGAQTLDQRINTVAAELCRNSRASDTRLNRRANRCVSDTRDHIRSQLPREARAALSAQARTAQL